MSGKPRPLGEILRSLLGRERYAAGMAKGRLLEDWESIVVRRLSVFVRHASMYRWGSSRVSRQDKATPETRVCSAKPCPAVSNHVQERLAEGHSLGLTIQPRPIERVH